mmetsp:Transcript_10484/g.25380  ORF Transcript_10484/g.25380 Transcript_10484/m.25380 type:complete len:200 (+) Transcript_10484:151-750(+)
MSLVHRAADLRPAMITIHVWMSIRHTHRHGGKPACTSSLPLSLSSIGISRRDKRSSSQPYSPIITTAIHAKKSQSPPPPTQHVSHNTLDKPGSQGCSSQKGFCGSMMASSRLLRGVRRRDSPGESWVGGVRHQTLNSSGDSLRSWLTSAALKHSVAVRLESSSGVCTSILKSDSTCLVFSVNVTLYSDVSSLVISSNSM